MTLPFHIIISCEPHYRSYSYARVPTTSTGLVPPMNSLSDTLKLLSYLLIRRFKEITELLLLDFAKVVERSPP